MAGVMASFQATLDTRFTCFFCDQMVPGRTKGALQCTYHPFARFSRRTNLVNSYAHHRPPPSDCSSCNLLHLSAPGSGVPASSVCRSRNAEHGSLKRGCTPIDHCTSIEELFSRPFIAMPTAFLSELSLTTSARARCPRGTDNTALLRHMRDNESNVIIVHKPRHLGMRVQIDIPGTSRPFTASIKEIYEEMALSFGLPNLDDAILKARLADPKARFTRMSQYMHRDARRKDSLRVRQITKVLFVPFAIVARVSQSASGSAGMKLV